MKPISQPHVTALPETPGPNSDDPAYVKAYQDYQHELHKPVPPLFGFIPMGIGWRALRIKVDACSNGYEFKDIANRDAYCDMLGDTYYHRLPPAKEVPADYAASSKSASMPRARL